MNARDLCAGINTIGTFIGDLTVLGIGTGLFTTDIRVSMDVMAAEKLAERSFVRKERFKFDRNRLPDFENRFDYWSSTNRMKNISNPKKWRL